MKELLIILFKDSFENNNAGTAQDSSLEHIFSITRDLQPDKFIFYNEPIPSNSIVKNKGYKECLTLGVDEQEQLLNAFVKGFLKDYTSIVLIKSNFKGLSKEIMEDAFSQLKLNDYVIGPSADKNFYLLGMKKLNTCLFEECMEETESHLRYEAAISIFESRNHSYYKLPELEEIRIKKSRYPEWIDKVQRKNKSLVSHN